MCNNLVVEDFVYELISFLAKIIGVPTSNLIWYVSNAVFGVVYLEPWKENFMLLKGPTFMMVISMFHHF